MFVKSILIATCLLANAGPASSGDTPIVHEFPSARASLDATGFAGTVLIHDLAQQGHANLLIVGGHGRDEPARNIGSHKLHLGEEGGQLAFRRFYVVRQLL